MRGGWIYVVCLALLLISPWPIIAFTRPTTRSSQIIAIPAEGPSLSDPVSHIFARARYFVVVDLGTNRAKAIENPFLNAKHAVGVRIAHLLLDESVGAVIVLKHIGPEPFRNLNDRGVRIFSLGSGSVQDAIERFRSNALPQLTEPTVPTHFGL